MKDLGSVGLLTAAEALRVAFGVHGIQLFISPLEAPSSTWTPTLEEYFRYGQNRKVSEIVAVVLRLPKPPKILTWPVSDVHVGSIWFTKMVSVREVNATGITQPLFVSQMENLRKVTHLHHPATLHAENCPRLRQVAGDGEVETKNCPKLVVG